MSADWFVQADGVELGPVTAHQVRSMAQAGQLRPTDSVRKGPDGEWVHATRVKGLFDGGDHASITPPSDEVPARPVADVRHRLGHVRSIDECVSPEERKKRFGVAFMSGLLWLAFILASVATMGFFLAFAAVGWFINRILAEYNVRRLQAFGTMANAEQFPEIDRALGEVCRQFEVEEPPRVIVLNSGEVNAMAIKFARKKVIVLLSEMLEGVIDRPAELRFILGHELGHHLLDHGKRGAFEIYKPAAYRAARELTCDNAGTASAGDLVSATTTLKRLGVGNKLHARLNDAFLQAEARYIYSGLTGWLLRQYMTYPPLGKRIENVSTFFTQHAR
jgi:Zn-dependent protease with chaperone function